MHGIFSNNWTKKKQLYLCEERRYFNFDMMKTHYSEKENFEFFRKKEVFFFFLYGSLPTWSKFGIKKNQWQAQHWVWYFCQKSGNLRQS